MLLTAGFEARALGDATGLEGAGIGGSPALWIVRACLAGGGAKIELYRL